MAVSGLAGFRKAQEQREESKGSGSKLNFPKLDDGEKVGLVFLQEMDVTGEHYSEKNGTFIFEREHSNPRPGEFWKRASCLYDEEDGTKCPICMYNMNLWNNLPEGEKKPAENWSANDKFYTTVLIYRNGHVPGDEDYVPEVAVFTKTANMNSELFTDLIDIFQDEGGVANRLFTYTKLNNKNKVSYKLKIAKGDQKALGENAGLNLEDFDVYGESDLLRVFDADKIEEALNVHQGSAAFSTSSNSSSEPSTSAASSGSYLNDDDFI